MVISTCKHCQKLHLIADNQRKLDMAEYQDRVDMYLEQKGEKVQRLTISESDLENYHLIDKDGEIVLHPKNSIGVSFYY
jgi:transcription elongation factor Elf1